MVGVAISYGDGRIGFATTTLAAVADIFEVARASLIGIDDDRSAEFSARLLRAKLAAASVAILDDVSAVLTDLLTTIRDVSRASTDPDSAASTWLAASASCAALQAGPGWAGASRAQALSNAVAGMAEAACVGEYAVAIAQSGFIDRPSALAAKQALAGDTAAALDRIARTAGGDVWSVLAEVVEQSVSHLAARALDLKPVVWVQTQAPLTATAIAWALYGDPQRAVDLVERNRVSTAALMPLSFEALAS